MSSQVLRKFAEELKSKREEKGITLHQIRNKTRLDIKFLEAIEEGNFHVMPEVYIKAFIREYAQAIDIDPDTTIEKYNLAKEGKYAEEKEIPLEKTESETPVDEQKFDSYEDEKASPEIPASVKKKTNYLPYIIGSAALIILIIVYFAFVRKPDKDIVLEKPFDEILDQTQERFEVAPVEQETSAPDSLILELSALDTTWLKYRIDDNESNEIIILPRRTKTLKSAESFRLHIGNAAGVNLTLDGNQLNLSGEKGQVRIVKIDSIGLSYISTGEYNE